MGKGSEEIPKPLILSPHIVYFHLTLSQTPPFPSIYADKNKIVLHKNIRNEYIYFKSDIHIYLIQA